jgi:hypothetical protein
MAISPGTQEQYPLSLAQIVKEGFSMKTLLLATLSLCFVLSIVAFAQDAANQASQEDQAAEAKLTTLSGTVKVDGDKLTFVTDADQKAWTVDNPATVRGKEGHHVQIKAHFNADKESIHITEVKTLAATEGKKNDSK